jgi:hypothetical protein
LKCVHRLVCLVLTPRLVVVFSKVVVALGDGTYLEKGGHWEHCLQKLHLVPTSASYPPCAVQPDFIPKVIKDCDQSPIPLLCLPLI